jgi:hypothetical protein
MKYFLILIFVCIPSIVLAQIKIGVFPIDFKGNEVSSQFKEKVKETIYKNLTIPSQIEVINLENKNIYTHYLLKISLKVSEDKADIELNLLETYSSKNIYLAKENVKTSEILQKIASHCEEIKKRLLSTDETPVFSSQEKKSFLSRINPFTKIDNLFSKLFSKEREFDIRVPIPPPPPPPGYAVKPYSSSDYSKNIQKSIPQVIQPEKKVYPPSPWQWF